MKVDVERTICATTRGLVTSRCIIQQPPEQLTHTLVWVLVLHFAVNIICPWYDDAHQCDSKRMANFCLLDSL